MKQNEICIYMYKIHNKFVWFMSMSREEDF